MFHTKKAKVAKDDDVIVSENSATSRWTKYRVGRTVLLLCMFATMLILIAGVLWRSKSLDKNEQAQVDISKCSSELLESAKSNLDYSKVVELEEQVREIESIPDYGSDPNCVFVALTYYINMSDPVKSRELLSIFTDLQENQQSYSNVLADVFALPEYFEPTVEFLENQAGDYPVFESGGVLDDSIQ